MPGTSPGASSIPDAPRGTTAGGSGTGTRSASTVRCVECATNVCLKAVNKGPGSRRLTTSERISSRVIVGRHYTPEHRHTIGLRELVNMPREPSVSPVLQTASMFDPRV
jgi:hypothetical protein